MAQLDNAADSDSEDRGFESLRAGQEISRLIETGNFFFKKGFEGRAGQSNSPVDCCDRERPSALRRANRNPFERAKKFLVSSRRGISFLRRDSKDERDRATVRWTVATASDQAPSGARIAIPSSGPRNFSSHRGGEFLFKTKGFEGRAVEKSTSSEVLFQRNPPFGWVKYCFAM